jgi:hypothetical protein
VSFYVLGIVVTSILRFAFLIAAIITIETIYIVVCFSIIKEYLLLLKDPNVESV